MLLNAMLKEDDFVPRGVMRNSYEADGSYLRVSSKGVIQLSPRALLAPETKYLNEVTCKVGRMVDITNIIHNDRQTEMRKISLVYPGFDDNDSVSTLFPLSDVVLKMRHDIGDARQKLRRDKTAVWAEGYGVSDLEVGIPAKTFMVIWNQLNRQLNDEVNEDWDNQAFVSQENPEESAFSVRGFRYQDGHYWVTATLQKTLMGATKGIDDSLVSFDVTAFMRDLRKSLKCNAATAFRLIRFNRGKWELRMTLWTVELKDVATQHDVERSVTPDD